MNDCGYLNNPIIQEVNMQKWNIKSDWQLLLLITKSPRGNHQVGFIITIIGFLFSFKLSIQAFYIYVYDIFTLSMYPSV